MRLDLRPRGPDDADPLAGPHVKVQVVQHGPARLVGEGHPGEAHVAPEARRRPGPGPVTDLHLGVEEIDDPLS